MPELEPITREEKLLDGEDLTPITRKEMFIKRIYDKTQSVPEPITREEMFLKKAGEGGGGDVTIEQLDVSENGTYSESGKAYSPVVVNVPLPQNAYLLKSVANLPQAIASFNDGEEMVMPSLKVAIEPQQDLHGYDSPWVGGAGKNKVDIADMHITSQTTMGRVTLPSGTYVASATVKNNSNIGGQIKINTSSTNIASATISNVSGTNRVATDSFTLSEPTEIVVVVSGTSSGYNFDVSQVQIELGTTATSFAPYSNICPISGWDEVDLTVADDVENPTVSNVYTIDLDGTRYGGEVDVVNGGGTDRLGYVDLGTLNWALENGIFRLNESIGAKLTADTSAVANMLCSVYKTVSQNAMGSTTTDQCIAGLNWSNGVRVKDSNYTTVADFKTAMSGVQLVYELATPQTIQLTPTAIKSLRGVNNVYANTGDITDAEYFSKEV